LKRKQVTIYLDADTWDELQRLSEGFKSASRWIEEMVLRDFQEGRRYDYGLGRVSTKLLYKRFHLSFATLRRINELKVPNQSRSEYIRMLIRTDRRWN